MKMDTTPRAVGNPRQHFVTNPKQYLLWLNKMDGRCTCYTSHNSYTSFDEHNNPSEAKIRNIFLDFDMDEENNITFKKVARDVQLVSDYLSEYSVQHSIAFSGRAGYHLYIHTKPSIESLSNGLTLKYKGIYAHLRRELNLKSLDQRCAEPKRLCRVPGSKYVKEGKKTDRKCYPLPVGEDVPKSKKEMYEQSKQPLIDSNIRRGTEELSINDLMEKWDVTPQEVPDEDLYGTADYHEPKGNFLKLIGEYFRPCVRSALFNANPPHFIRVASCIKVKQLYSLQGAIKLYDRLAEEAQWIDRDRKGNRDYNIKHIYNKHYKLPSCAKIMMEGYCIGEECQYYDDFEKKKESNDKRENGS